MSFTNLRKFHNFIKNLYIKKYNGSRLLDLASGKGGDLNKWFENKKIEYVLGYDINQESILEANKRLDKLKKNGMKNKTVVKFFVADLSNIVLKPKVKFDIISSQFAFHYFFKNNDSINTILESIDNSSKVGTILLLSLFDGNKILALPKCYKHDRFYIKRLSNNSIEVKINNTVLDKPETEYIVTPEMLEKELKKINFILLEIKPFDTLYSDKFGLSSDEKKLSFLNNMYVFVKF